MEDLSNKTPIELQKMFNDLQVKHESTKEAIIELTYQIDELSELLNEKIEMLTEVEKDYVLLAEEIDKR